MLLNKEGEAIKAHEADMNYLLFSKDGKEFPLKLGNKVKIKDLEALGFNDVGVIDLEKNESGEYIPKTSPEQNEKLQQTLQEFFVTSEKEEKLARKQAKEDPRSTTIISKDIDKHESMRRTSNLAKIAKALEQGEELDNELYDKMLEEYPQYKKIRQRRKQQKKEQMKEKVKEEQKISEMTQRARNTEQREQRELERNRESMQEAEAERALDTMMRDEWNRVRMAQVSVSNPNLHVYRPWLRKNKRKEIVKESMNI